MEKGTTPVNEPTYRVSSLDIVENKDKRKPLIEYGPKILPIIVFKILDKKLIKKVKQIYSLFLTSGLASGG